MNRPGASWVPCDLLGLLNLSAPRGAHEASIVAVSSEGVRDVHEACSPRVTYGSRRIFLYRRAGVHFRADRSWSRHRVQGIVLRRVGRVSYCGMYLNGESLA